MKRKHTLPDPADLPTKRIRDSGSESESESDLDPEQEAWKDFDEATHTTTPNSNPAKDMTELYKLIGKIWRFGFSKSFYPVSRSMHRCDAEFCKIEQVLAHYCLDSEGGILHVCVHIIRRDGILTDNVSNPIQPTIIVKCGGKILDHSPESTAEIRRQTVSSGSMEDLFICTQTGHMHVCTMHTCPYATDHEETHGDRVCRLTGRVLSERESVSEFWLPRSVKGCSGASFLSSDSSSKNKDDGKPRMSCLFRPYTHSTHDETSNDFLLTDDMSVRDVPTCDVSQIREYLSWRRRRRSVNRNPYREYLIIALLRISVLFSRTRYLIDMRVSREAFALANREVYRQLKTGRNDDAVSLRITQAHALKNRNIPDNLVLCREDRQNFLMSYAKRCVQFWAIIRTRTKYGSENPNLFPFSDFVISCMYIFKSGIYLPPEVTHGAGDQLLEEDVLLKRCLPRFDVIQELDCDRSLTTRIKKDIIQAIMTAVRDERIDTARLHPNSIQPEHLEDAIYKNLRKNKTNLNPKK
jgi:hypothetical protein